jgi:hypothetical protein
LIFFNIAVTLLDSAGGRQLTAGSWATANAIMLCVDVSDHMSAGKLKETVLDVAAAAKVPIILIGTKSDKRESSTNTPLSVAECEQLAKEIGAVKYVETSALQLSGLKEAFDEACRIKFGVRRATPPTDTDTAPTATRSHMNLVLQGASKSDSKSDSKKYNLKISVTSGTVSEAQDSNGLADPYLKIKQGVLSSWTSKVQKKTLSPSWNETGVVKLGEASGKSVSITIELWDQDALKYVLFTHANTLGDNLFLT